MIQRLSEDFTYRLERGLSAEDFTYRLERGLVRPRGGGTSARAKRVNKESARV